MTETIVQIWKILKDRTAMLCILAFAAVFGMVQSLSRFVYEQNTLAVDLKSALIVGAGCWAILTVIYVAVMYKRHYETPVIASPRLWWSVIFALLVALHTLCWMVYWPADIAHDNMYILMNGTGMAHLHPIMYTAYVSLLKNIGIMFGTARYGVILFVLVQILLIDAIIAVLLMRLIKMRIPLFWKVLSVGYYFGLPMFAVFNTEMSAAALWAVALTVFTFELYEIISRDVPLKRNWIALWIATFFVMILYTNSIYIVCGMLAILYCWKDYHRGRGLWTVFLVAIIAFFGQALAMRAIGAHRLFQERAGIPLQQIAAVAKYDGKITERQQDFIEAIVPLSNLKVRYNPYDVNPIKWQNPEFNRDVLEDNAQEFLQIWSEMMWSNFKIYTLAYLQATYWWWAPRQEGTVQYRQTWDHHKPWLTAFALRNNLMERSMIGEGAAKYLRQYYDLSGYFLREGVLFWLLAAIALLYGLKRRNWRDLAVFAPSLFLWLTIMTMTPVAQSFRVVAAYAYMLPFFGALLLTDKTTEKENLLYPWMPLFKKLWQKYLFFLLLAAGVIYAARVMYVKIMNHMPIDGGADIYTTFAQEPKLKVYDKGIKLLESEQMPLKNRRGVTFSKTGNKADLAIKALDNTEIHIDLRGCKAQQDENGSAKRCWVKYRAFEIDNRAVADGYVKASSDKPYEYSFKAKKGKIYKLKLKWRKP